MYFFFNSFVVTFHPLFGRKSFWVFVLLLHTSDSLSSIYPLKSVRRPCPVYFYYRFYDYIALSPSCTLNDLLSMWFTKSETYPFVRELINKGSGLFKGQVF